MRLFGTEPASENAAPTGTRKRALGEALVASIGITVWIGVASIFFPESIQGAAISGAFLFATWFCVWRYDDETVGAHGLLLGGLVVPGALDTTRILGSLRRASLLALAVSLLFFPLYGAGWHAYWKPEGPFQFQPMTLDFGSFVLAQIFLVALPEEAFYRGFLLTRFSNVFPARFSLLGGRVGIAVAITSLVFALGHIVPPNSPSRLTVFFPALVFSWLRLRSGGIGAGVLFHAMCNVFSHVLASGYAKH